MKKTRITNKSTMLKSENFHMFFTVKVKLLLIVAKSWKNGGGKIFIRLFGKIACFVIDLLVKQTKK